MRKNILHIAFKHNKDDMRIFLKECTSLAKNPDYKVTYLTSDVNSECCDDIKNGVERIIIKAMPKRIIRALIYNNEVKKYISDNQVDLIHIHEITLLLLAKWARRHEIKVIFDSHEDYYKQIKSRHGAFAAMVYKLYEKHVCKTIDGVIFPCPMLDKELFDYPLKRFVYIDNYPIINKGELEFKEKKPFVACYTGTLAKDRGVNNAVLAWKKAGIKGLLAGKFNSNSEKAEIMELIEGSNIEYAGILPSDCMNRIYEKSSVGMATLRRVGQYQVGCNLPTKVGEYMMNGMPTIIYSSPYVEEVMKQYEFGIMVDSDNIEEMADAIKYLRDNPSEVKRMGENAIEAVKNVFNWDTQEKKLFELYNEILNN